MCVDQEKPRNPSGKVVTILIFPPKQHITCQKPLGSSATLQVFGIHVDDQMGTEELFERTCSGSECFHTPYCECLL